MRKFTKSDGGTENKQARVKKQITLQIAVLPATSYPKSHTRLVRETLQEKVTFLTILLKKHVIDNHVHISLCARRKNLVFVK